MKYYALLFWFLLFSIGKTNAQIVANGNSGSTVTAYTNGTPNDPIHIWCATGLSNNTASLTANSPSGPGTYTFNWFYHNEVNSSWTAYSSQTGASSTISNLPSDGYRVQIYNSSNVLVACYVAWVWNMNGQVNPTSTPTACNATNLAGNVGVNGSFSYYNPPLPPSIITANTQISVCFSATHTYVSDLAFYLVGPPSCGSPTILLSPNPGAIGQNNICNGGDNVSNLCFSNTATSNLNVCSATTPLTGNYNTYGPSSTPINWSALYGCNAAQGGWAVRIYDCIGADVGALTNATISFSNLQSVCGSLTNVSYSSGAINSAINDNSCSAATASIFQVPVSPVLTNPITLNATTVLQWIANPTATIPNPNSSNTSVIDLPDGNYNFTLIATVTYGPVSCTYAGSTSFLSASLDIPEPEDLSVCGTPPLIFDLTHNTPIVDPAGIYQVSYHNTLATAQNNTAPIAVPTAYPSNGNGEIIYVRVQSSPICYEVKDFTLNLSGFVTPTFDPVGPVCVGDVIPPLPTTSNNSINGVWSPALNNTQTTTYTFTPDVGECADPMTMQIVVSTPPVIAPPTPLEICDDNNDGFSTFDLTVKNNEITNGNATLVVTYHETSINAQNGVGAINPATAYQNVNQNTQTIYIRVVELNSNCPSFETLQIVVLPKPTVVSVSNYELCDYTNPGDGIEEFDLGTKIAEISNGQTNVSVRFYLSQILATAGTAGTELPLLYQNVVSNPQTVYYRIENNTTGCFATGSFNLIVNLLPQITTPTTLSACGANVAGQAQFDLTIKTVQIINGQNGYNVTYHTTAQGANTETDEINPATNHTGFDGEIIYVRVENIDTGCFVTTQFDLEVIDAPAPIMPDPLYYCDPNNDGFGVFDLSAAAAQILAGNPNMTVTFHETASDASFGVSPVGLTYNNINQWTQTLYVRLESNSAGCSYFGELQLIVNPTPVAVTPDPIQVCDDNADGFAIFNITIRNSQILNGANPQLHQITYHITEANAIADSNAITSVLAFTNTTPNSQTIWVRVEIIATGCYDVVPMELIVNPLPVVPFPATPYELCDVNNTGDEFEEFDLGSYIPTITSDPTMIVTYHFDQASALAGTPSLPLLYTNQVAGVQTIFVRVTNSDTQCFAITLLDLRVEPLPVPVIPDPVVECDLDGDGFATFDLQALIIDILDGAPNTVITFHETYINADLNVFPLGNTYENVNAFAQTIYIRAENTQTGCYAIVPMELRVNASPEMPNLQNLQICDNNQDGIHTIDLTQQTQIILDAQTGGSTYNIKYFTSLANAQAGISAIVTPTNYLGTNGQTIWVSITDTVTECFTIGSFQLEIDTPLALNPAYSLSVCDNLAPSNDSIGMFDLTSMNSVITGNVSGYTVQYYLTLSNAQSDTDAITTPEAFSNGSISGINNPYTLFVAVTNTNTTCRSYTTLTIRVLPIPTPNTDPQDLIACDDVNSPNGTEIFDLTTNEGYIRNNDPALTFAYYPTEADAIAQTNQIMVPTAYEGVGIVYIRVMNSQADSNGNNCYVIVEQLLIVNPLPIVATSPVINAVCQQNNTSFATFTLSNSNEDVLDDSQNTADFTFTYHISQADAQTGNNPLTDQYVNLTNPQDIYVRVVNNLTGCVNPTAVVTLIADDGAIANPVDANDPDIASIITTCDDDGTNDGFHVFNLSDLDETILGSQSTDPNYTIHYYTSQDLIDQDIANGGPATTNPSAIQTPGAFVNTEAFVQTIYAVVINTASVTGCPSIVSFPITVNPLPEPIIDNQGGIICVEFGTSNVLTPIVLSTQYTSATHTFEWSLGGSVVGTDETFTITSMANATAVYSVIATDIVTGCSSNAVQTTIIRSGPPVITNVQVTNAFTENQIITVTASGFGTYEYQIDNGPWQTSNVFSSVSIGEHIVTVRDILRETGCGSDTEDAMAIGYPNYFTPNGDGIHDTWNIVGLDETAQIFIFDRYGKLVKQISAVGAGWDGTMNGQLLPSTDYWFKVIFIEQNVIKEFRAHFSLKR